MMKLYYTKRSPYARKCLMVAIEKGLEESMTLVEVDLANKPAALLAANPLGKIPVLVTEEGASFFDSPVICEYLDSLAEEPALFPVSKSRYHVLKVAAVADGIMDSAVGIVMENMRPEDKQMEKAITKHRNDIERALAELEGHSERLKTRFTIAAIGAACALGYLNFRLPDIAWQEKYPGLKAFYDDMSQRTSFKETAPKA